MLTAFILALAILFSVHSVIDVIKASKTRTLTNLSPMLYVDIWGASIGWGYLYYLIH